MRYSQKTTTRDDFAHLVHIYMTYIAQLLDIFDIFPNHSDTHLAQSRHPDSLFIVNNLFPFGRFSSCRFGLFGLLERVDTEGVAALEA